MTVAVPAWVDGLTEARLRAGFGAPTVSRGTAYARQGAVQQALVQADGALTAQVTGSGGRSYRVRVTSTPRGVLDGRCSCPMAMDCKHVVAALLHLRAQSSPARPRAWEAQLVGLVEPDEPAHVDRLALLVDVVATTGRYAVPPKVRLRPARRAASGRWVRAGASWRDLDHAYGPQRRDVQRDAVRALHAAWRVRQSAWVVSGDHLDLADIGPAAWRLLAEAQDAGVPLLDDAGQPTVRLVEAARVVTDLQAAGLDGDVALQVRVRFAAEAAGALALVGSPPTGVAVRSPEGLLLAPFDRPLDEATAGLLRAGGLRLPAADLPRFYRRYYPGLRRRTEVVSSDGSVELPELLPPRLVLAVRLGAGHVADLTWSYSYCVLGEAVEVPLTGPTEEVVRDRPAERRLLDALADLPHTDGMWALDAAGRRLPVPQVRLQGLDTARFMSTVLPELEDSLAVQVRLELADQLAEGPPAYGESREAVQVAVRAGDAPGTTDWFDLAVTVTLGGAEVPLPSLLAALARGEEHLLLDDGRWFALDTPPLQGLARLVAEARGLQDREPGRLRLSPYQAGLWEELVELGVVTAASERWTRTVGGLLSLGELPHPELPLKLNAELRPYQLEGYTWLCLLWDLGLGGVLADDMGLGKTLQTLAMAARAWEAGELEAPLLVVAPTSVVGTWGEQALDFCPDLPVELITETERRSGQSVAVRARGAAVVVTSYALLRLDDASYLSQPWSGVVLDEAQHVKNPAAKTYSVVRRLQAPFALAITGTPLENSLMDLWALLSITAPGLFPDPQRFSEEYRRPIESGAAPEQLAALRRRLRPLMLRRTKEQVAADLPPKIEQVVEVELGPQHRKVYDRHLQRERQRVLGLLDNLQRNRFEVLRALTVLRQLSLDPGLVDDRHAAVGSAKIDLLVERLREVAVEGHRALVFSSFTGFLRRVRERLDAEGIDYCYLDGRTRDRPRRIAEFREGDAPAFLISLKAGGTGLTLTEADYVFVLDPWWNPAAEAQAVDRAHRIGQDRTVMVYRLVATGTVEEKVVALQHKKRELFTAVVDGDGAASTALTAEDFRALLA